MSNTHTQLCIAGEAITAYRFVTVEGGDSERVDLADAAGEKCLGVATGAAAAADDEVLVAVAGYTLVDFGEAAEAFDDITTDANGKAILADTATHNILGYYAPEPVTAPCRTSAAASAVASTSTPTRTFWFPRD